MTVHQVTRDFESALCSYTGAPYAVAVNSCTAALLLAVAWFLRKDAPMTATMVRALQSPGGPHIEIPKRTYVGVPMSIIHAGGRPVFREEEWKGAYHLKPFPVWDAARLFTSGMYAGQTVNAIESGKDCRGQMLCVSFHAAKTLGDTQGGAILHDDEEADRWLRMARFDGRQEGVAPKDQKDWIVGHHCYISPDVSARLLWALSVLPKHNEPLPNDDYPDLSQIGIFQ